MSRPEARVERWLVNAARALKGNAIKIVSPGLAGVPDRLVILPLKEQCPCCGQRARHAFVEVKDGSGKPEPLQSAVATRLSRLGAFAGWVNDRNTAEALVAGLAVGEEPVWRR